MSEKILCSVFEFYEACGGKFRRNEEGKITNRASAYDFVRRLPDDCKVWFGSSLKINVPKARKYIDRGGQLDPANEDFRPLEAA